MEIIAEYAVRFIRAGGRAYERKWSFLGYFIAAFLANVLVLGFMGLLPETGPKATAETITEPITQTPAIIALPTKIEIPKINLVAVIENPAATDVAVLDQALLSGAVRYPTSAKLGETGNVVLFGHSSYLPVVGNQAYKTFNGIQKLVSGDTIVVYSADTAYTYKVRSVAKKSAKDAVIELRASGRVLTLSTCNSFGAKEDRFIVTADFVESRPISS